MRESASTSQEALSSRKNSMPGCGSCALRMFFGVFFIAGAGMLYFMTLRPLWGVYQARSWQATPCTIVTSEVERHRGDDSDTFSIEVTYRYTFDGQQYLGDRYHFFDISSNGRRGKQQVVDALPPGKQTTCYVNPADPEETVIQRELTADMWWSLFPLPFLLVGAGGLIFGPRMFNPKSPLDTQASIDDSSPGLMDNSAADGPVVLKPDASPIGVFFVSLFVCAFWNGITSVFVYQVVDGFRNGNPEWFLTVFMIPFVLVGLGLLLWMLYAFLNLFNPRPELTLSRGNVPLGEMAQMSWEFRGSVRSIRNFKISLVGEERATYRRGTDTHTDSEMFFEHVFYEAEHAAHIASGGAEFEVPGDSMHSFDSYNNKIGWSLHVAGEIPLRPDVNLRFPIQVLPHERAAD